MRNVGYLSDDGVAAANYNFSVRVQNAVPNEPFADFSKDFSIENNPSGGWEYGVVEYFWNGDGEIKANAEGGESFDYSKLTDKTADAWIADGVELKGGWLSAERWATIVYTAQTSMSAEANISFEGGQETTHVILRLVVTDGNGKFKANRFIDGGSGSWSQKITGLQLNEGDKIYLMFAFEDTGYKNGSFSYTLTQN